MKKRVFIKNNSVKLCVLFWLWPALLAVGAFTEFYCEPTAGSNLNAGSTEGAAELTSANGNWDSATGVFICLGTPDLSAVAVGEWASVYTDGASVGVFVGRITAVVDATDTITVSLTAKSGTPPSTSATARTIKVGGAWKGPNAAEDFPFDFVQATMSNASGDVPRVNFKSGVNYGITAAVAHSQNGPIRWQGYTTTPGDFGRATLADVTTTASYVFLTVSGANNDFADLIFDGSVFSSGSSIGVSVTGAEHSFIRCVFHDFRGSGASSSQLGLNFEECEFYLNGKNNSAGMAGLAVTGAGNNVVNSFFHDNAGSNVAGLDFGGSGTISFSVFDTNGKEGLRVISTTAVSILQSDFYNNVGAGIDFTGATAARFTVRNCNFIKNGTYGINSSGTLVLHHGSIINCGFGAGTEANTSGQIVPALTGMDEIGSVTYTANSTPWFAPATGDFRINLAAAKGAGRGAFTQTQASYTGTVAYPDIGAAQHLESAGATGGSYTFGQ